MKVKESLGICGFYDPVKQLIVVDETMDKAMKNETLVHEFVHALSSRLSWRQAIPKELEEVMCDQIAKAFVENFDIKLKK